MSLVMDEWKCSMCTFTVWRFRLRAERFQKHIEFRHSKIHADGSDPLCAGWLTRTGNTRNGYVDEVFDGHECRSLYPRFARFPEEVTR